MEQNPCATRPSWQPWPHAAVALPTFAADIQTDTGIIDAAKVISYVRQVGETQLLAELKWLPELDTKNRMEGDYVWFKRSFLF